MRSLADRLVGLVRPERSLHVQGQVRSGILATDRAVAAWVTSMTSSDDVRVSASAINRAIDHVQEAAGPVCERAPDASDAYDALLRGRLRLHLDTLDLAQLDRLEDGLNSYSDDDSMDATHERLVREVLAAARAPKQARLDALLEAAQQRIAQPLLAAVPTDMPGAMSLLDDAYDSAERLLAAHGLEAGPEMQRALVMASISDYIGKAPDGQERARANAYGEIIRLLPSEELQALHRVSGQALVGARPPADVAGMVQGQVAARAQLLEEQFQRNFALLSAVPRRDGAAVARQALAACKGLDELRTHADLHGIRLHEDFALLGEALGRRLRDVLDGVAVDGLDNEELVQLQQALREQGGPMGAVRKEMDLRRAHAVQRHAQALRALMDAVAGDSLPDALAALESARDASDLAVRIHQQLGHRITHADRAEFVRALLEDALSLADPQSQAGLREALSHPGATRLLAALHGTGQQLERLAPETEGEDSTRYRLPDAARRAQGCAAYLQGLMDASGIEGSQDAPVADGDPQDDALMLAQVTQAFAAPQDVPFARTGQFSEQAQSIFQGNLRDMRNQPAKASSLEPRISEDMRRDLRRADFHLDTGVGRDPQELIDRGSGASAEAQVHQAVRSLHVASGRDRANLQHLAHYAHQGLLAGVEKVFASAHSPLAIDGESGRMRFPAVATRVEYLIEPQEQGGWVLRVDYRFNPDLVVPIGQDADGFDVAGVPSLLDASRSFVQVGAVLRISATGQADLAQPLTYAFALHRPAA